MVFRLLVAVRPGPTPVFLSFLPDQLLFLGVLEPMLVALHLRPYRLRPHKLWLWNTSLDKISRFRRHSFKERFRVYPFSLLDSP